jgi:hypothetical protein
MQGVRPSSSTCWRGRFEFYDSQRVVFSGYEPFNTFSDLNGRLSPSPKAPSLSTKPSSRGTGAGSRQSVEGGSVSLGSNLL